MKIAYVRRQVLCDSLRFRGSEALACFSLGSFSLVLQSSVFDGVSFDPFTLKQEGAAASEVDVSRRQVLQASVVAVVIVVIDEARAIAVSGFLTAMHKKRWRCRC